MVNNQKIRELFFLKEAILIEPTLFPGSIIDSEGEKPDILMQAAERIIEALHQRCREVSVEQIVVVEDETPSHGTIQSLESAYQDELSKKKVWSPVDGFDLTSSRHVSFSTEHFRKTFAPKSKTNGCVCLSKKLPYTTRLLIIA